MQSIFAFKHFIYVVKIVFFMLLCLRVFNSDCIFFRLLPNGNSLFSSASLSLGMKINYWGMNFMTAVELHLNATNYTEHLILESSYTRRSMSNGR